jgi:hypothetical protein
MSRKHLRGSSALFRVTGGLGARFGAVDTDCGIPVSHFGAFGLGAALIDQGERPEAGATDQANRPGAPTAPSRSFHGPQASDRQGRPPEFALPGLRALAGGGKTLPFGSGFLNTTGRGNCEAKRYTLVFLGVKRGSSLPCLGSLFSSWGRKM